MLDLEILPESWSLASIGDVCSHPQYGYTTKASQQGDIKLLRTTDITSGEIDWNAVPFCSKNPDNPEKYLLAKGDIVVSRAGSIGVSYLIEKPRLSVFASYLIRFNPFVDKKYFRYFLNSPFYWNEISENKSGIAVQNVNAQKLRIIPFPVAPVEEQNRIVAKIEELFSEIDKGVESLETAKAQLKVYRQALLKHAFEGKLTAQWRAENPDKVVPAEQLLEQIKQAREERYQQQLDDWKAAVEQWELGGKEGQKPGKPKVLEPINGNESNLESLKYSLPKTGVILKVSQCLREKPRNGKSVTDRAGGFRVLRLTCLKGEKINLDENKEGNWDYENAKQYIVWEGDFLISRGNGSLKLVGRGGLVTENRDVAYPDTMIRLPIEAKIFRPRLFALFWNSAVFRQQIETTARTTAGIYKINQQLISEYSMPCFSLIEQDELLKILEAELTTIDTLIKDLEHDLLKANALRQSILKKAFSGQLVPQDPNDEPASELLARIKAEKAERQAQTKATKAKKPRTPRKTKVATP